MIERISGEVMALDRMAQRGQRNAYWLWSTSTDNDRQHRHMIMDGASRVLTSIRHHMPVWHREARELIRVQRVSSAREVAGWMLQARMAAWSIMSHEHINSTGQGWSE